MRSIRWVAMRRSVHNWATLPTDTLGCEQKQSIVSHDDTIMTDDSDTTSQGTRGNINELILRNSTNKTEEHYSTLKEDKYGNEIGVSHAETRRAHSQ